MADTNSLRVMCLFEAGARLICGSEVVSLAAHLYHRFFRLESDMNQFDLYTFAAACIKLAYWFYESPIDSGELALVMSSIVHGSEYFLNAQTETNLQLSIDYAAKIVAINLDYQINYKDNRMMTPGDLRRSRGAPGAAEVIVIEVPAPMDVDDDTDDDDSEDEDEVDRLNLKNCKHLVSAHRYLAHYLKTISLLVDRSNATQVDYFKKVSSISWAILTDLYWSPFVTQHYGNHLACTCLMMAIEIFRKELELKKLDQSEPWQLISKKWNLIFCDDLSDLQLDRLMTVILRQYAEYERVLEHEFSTYVIDPSNKNRNI